MPRLLRSVARTAVVAGTATAVSNGVSRRQAGRWAAKEQAAQPPQPQAAPPAAAPGTDTNVKLQQIQQLGELKSQGLLSEEEFQAQKTQILNS